MNGEGLETAVEQVKTAYGDALPDWIAVLATKVDASSRAQVAKKVSYSKALISQVMSNKYPASTATLEERVRGIWMREIVDCPVLGETPLHICQLWRRRLKGAANHNDRRVKMHRACRRCPVHLGGHQ